MPVRFILASASPARRATLLRAGVVPEVQVSGFDESAIDLDDAAELVVALASAKANSIAETIDGDALVLGCDSLLEFEGVALGKPADADEAVRRWRTMTGRSGVLHTGHALLVVSNGMVTGSSAQLASTTVNFAEISEAEIAHYVASREPLAVAGAFTLDGLGGWFVESVVGDHHNVVGLSLPLLRRMLADAGFTLADVGWPTSP
jgi:septum formation protein